MTKDWVHQQTNTTHHKLAVILLPIVIFLGYINPIIFGIGLFIFFLVTSFKMLKTMLLWIIVLGLVSLILPFLAPIIFIIMVVLFFMRIGYVITNWRPFVSGILLYGMSGILITRSIHLNSYYYYTDPMLEGVIMAGISFVGLHFLLRWLYTYNYTSYAALGIMGSVPVIIIAFILPFLKLHVGGDFFTSETVVETKPVTSEGYGDGRVSTGEPVGTRTNLVTEQPTVYVKDHIRTAPDGDPTNNLSYEGPDKKAPNTEIVHVSEHVRTAPDGDPTNNLSYSENSHSLEDGTYHEASATIEEKDKFPGTKFIENSQAAVPGQVALAQIGDKVKKYKEEKK